LHLQSVAFTQMTGYINPSVATMSCSSPHWHRITSYLHPPNLVGFEYARHKEDGTTFTYDSDFEKNLYRHLDRQGRPTVAFKTAHDVYALGPIPLEIGIWKPLRSIWQESVDKIEQITGKIPQHNSKLIKGYFVQAAKGLAHTMGPAYAEAVSYIALMQASIRTFKKIPA
jgi:hypothetical protein